MARRMRGIPTYSVEPRDVPTKLAAQRLHLTEEEFEAKKPFLFDRNFPRPDVTTGMYDLKMIDQWMDERTTYRERKPRDASIDFDRRLKNLVRKIDRNK